MDDIANLDYDALMEVIRRRRSVRRFEKGRSVPRDTLLQIAEAARWAPTGANTQCWDLVIVDDPAVKTKVFDVFMHQSERLFLHAKGFPHVRKAYVENTVAILIVLGDPRWKRCFPQASSPEMEAEYDANNDNIYLASLGAVIQNIQLAVTAVGLISAWLSGGGEATTNKDLRAVLGYPAGLEAIGTIPIGYPEKDNSYRYRRPVDQLVHWNGYEPTQYRPTAMIDYYEEKVRPFAMYRNDENMTAWDDAEEKLGPWEDAFTGKKPNPSGEIS